MQRSVLALAAAALVVTAGPAAAGDPVLEAMGRCSAVSADAARLACYDGLVPRVRAALNPAGAPGGAAPAKTAALPTKEEERSWFGFDMGDLFGTSPQTQTTPAQFGAEKTPAAEAQRTASAEALDSITAKVVDYALNPFGKFFITLDNGQIWRQLPADDGRAYFARDPASNTVTIERGMLGSYVLSINGGNRGFKVTRVK